MKTLAQHLQDYLTLRRSLGFKLRQADCLLRQFIRFADEQRASYLTTPLAVRWATQPTEVLPVTLAGRYQIVRHFALYLSTLDARTEVPPAGLLVYRKRRTPPYFYILYRSASGPLGANSQAAAFVRGSEGAHTLYAAWACGGDGHAHRRGNRSGSPGRGSLPGVAHYPAFQRRPGSTDTGPCFHLHHAPAL